LEYSKTYRLKSYGLTTRRWIRLVCELLKATHKAFDYE